MNRRWKVRSSLIVAVALLLLPVGVLFAVDGGTTAQVGDVKIYISLMDNGKRDALDDSGESQLSYPVVWADEISKLPPGPATIIALSGAYEVIDNDAWYYQRDPENLWQAETILGSDYLTLAGTDKVYVDWIDWGDNLEAKDWCLSQVVRVETVLYQDLPPDVSLDGYPMQYLSGEGMDEIWLMNDEVLTTTDALVFSPAAHLTIQRIDVATADTLTWDPAVSRWVGTGANDPLFSGAVHEAEDGPGFYNSEVNVAGKLIYGFNWKVRDMNDGVGTYRLTFSIDDPAHHTDLAELTGFAARTSFSEAQIRIPVEEELEAILAEAEADDEAPTATSPNTAVVVPELNLTYIDVEITPSKGGH